MTRQKRFWIGLGITIVVLPVLWFVAVDRSLFIQQCPRCGWGSEVVEYRISGQPISTEIPYNNWTIPDFLAKDLGVPCQHPQLNRWHKHRHWGLVYCAKPCINGTIWLDGEQWYDEEVSQKIRAYAKAHPELAAEFERRVLDERDFEFMRDILKDAGVTREHEQ